MEIVPFSATMFFQLEFKNEESSLCYQWLFQSKEVCQIDSNNVNAFGHKQFIRRKQLLERLFLQLRTLLVDFRCNSLQFYIINNVHSPKSSHIAVVFRRPRKAASSFSKTHKKRVSNSFFHSNPFHDCLPSDKKYIVRENTHVLLSCHLNNFLCNTF